MFTARAMKAFVTGGAGFVGSHCVDFLLSRGWEVIAYDNFSSGRRKNIEHSISQPAFSMVYGDVLDQEAVEKELSGCSLVIHCAANPDISRGRDDTMLDYIQGTEATFRLLRAVAKKKIEWFIYFSGSGVYGDRGNTELTESLGPFSPISMYGASKLSCEGFISAFAYNFDFHATILRPANIVGPRQSHGVLYDFIRKLKANSNELKILGDGMQLRSYIHVRDVINALDICMNVDLQGVDIVNVSSNTWCTVMKVAEIALESLGIKSANIRCGTDPIGWVGDVPKVRLNCDKIKSRGWKPTMTSEQALWETVKVLIEEI